MPKEYQDLEIARANRGPIAHLWNNPNWIAEEKCDGWRIQIHFGKPCSRLYAITRGGEEVGLNISHLTPQVNLNNLQYTVLDGELLPSAGNEFHSLAGIRSGKVHNVVYKVFDILYLNGIDVRGFPLEKRKELVAVVLNTIYLNHPFISAIKEARKETYKFLLEQLENKEEGVILKNLHSTYGNDWFKAKKVSTFDAFITGFEVGYNTFSECGKVHLAVCDGITIRAVGKCGIQIDNIRAEMCKDPRGYIGRVVELKALKIDPTNGLLREPRFVRLRQDLKPTECTWRKLNQDALVIELE